MAIRAGKNECLRQKIRFTESAFVVRPRLHVDTGRPQLGSFGANAEEEQVLAGWAVEDQVLPFFREGEVVGDAALGGEVEVVAVGNEPAWVVGSELLGD